MSCAIVPLSIVLLMREEAYEYGEIGVVVGAEAIAVGLTAALVGRLVDRVGMSRVVLATGAVTTVALCAETVAILSGAAPALLVAIAALHGATIPPISASMRSLWSRLVREDTLESAFAFDAIQLELVFVAGPLIAAGLATAISPATDSAASARSVRATTIATATGTIRRTRMAAFAASASCAINRWYVMRAAHVRGATSMQQTAEATVMHRPAPSGTSTGTETEATRCGIGGCNPRDGHCGHEEKL